MKNAAPLRASIKAALEAPANRSGLRLWLARRLPALGRSVRVPTTAPLIELERFVHGYMRRLPDYLRTVSGLTTTLEVAPLAQPLLQTAEEALTDVVRESPRRDAQRSAALLVDLLHMAYFADRLLEETNDYCVAASGGPQLPHDMTVATLICHDLIGEPFANELDAAVAAMVERCLAGRPLPRPRSVLRRPQVHWPQPPRNLALAGRFGSTRNLGA